MRDWNGTLRGLAAACALALAGCAGLPTPTATAPAVAGPSVELREVPFFPQQEYQCGPAALATALGAAGLSVTPEQLAPQVYLPGREGSLQAEMAAAARRHGMVAYPLEGGLEVLYAEVAAGTPVVVLQNLALPWFPKWHYAVVVGFDAARGEVLLRSGQERRLAMPLDVFDRTWERSARWGMAVLPPQRVPASADAARYLQAVVALEQARQPRAARDAYAAAARAWPDNLVAWMGLGNASYALGDLVQAERAFREATLRHPESAAAFNNLADHEKISETVEMVCKEFKEKAKYYRMAFRSVSTLIAYSDPSAAFKFLSPLCGRRKRDQAVSMFLVEKGMHGEQEIQMLGSIMDGMVDFKLDQLKSFFSIQGISDVQSRSYIRYTVGKHGLSIGSFSLDHIR